MAGPEITITDAEGAWVVRALGAIIGESTYVKMLKEGDFPEVPYVPREDITMAFLDVSETKSTCPDKGVATHYDFVGKNRTLRNFARSYDDAKGATAGIKGHLTFDPEQATVESVS